MFTASTGQGPRTAPGRTPGLWRALFDAGVAHERRSVHADLRLARAGASIDRIYFPIDSILLIARQTPSDPIPLTVGIVGSEGLVGSAALLASPRWSHDAIVIVPGSVISVAVHDLDAAGTTDPALRDLLLRVVNNQMLQLAQSVVANLGHSVERRLARWLTMLDDRTVGDMIAVTHDQLAQLLNVRRATVTDALHVLEGERLLRSTRGRVQIRDRAGLVARCGQSYGLSENDYRTAIGPFGKSSTQQ